MTRFQEFFNRDDLWIAAGAIVVSAYFLTKALALVSADAAGWPWSETCVAITGLVFGIVLLGGHGWGRWLGIPWLVSVSVQVIIDGFKLGWDFGALLSAGLLVGVAAYYYSHFFVDAKGD